MVDVEFEEELKGFLQYNDKPHVVQKLDSYSNGLSKTIISHRRDSFSYSLIDDATRT